MKKVSDDYNAMGFNGEVKTFIDDIASVYARADLVICRAGATTIAELTALGKPSILVPYPHAVHGHQEINARALVSAGRADMVLDRDLDGTTLAGKIRKYMENREELKSMSSLALKAGRAEAKKVIVEELIKVMRKPV